MSKDVKQQALDYHSQPKPGKVAIEITKSCETQQDLSLAYTPGVAEPVRAIASNPELAYEYTAVGNLVGVITDGTAVLGLGNVGALAGKPVMEGKGVLFKKFADVDVFDIEINADSTEEFINTIVNIAPTFGGINLEDIAAPSCFEIEEKLQARLNIPVFHDDQHGTAIIICAGLINALHLQEKTIDAVKIVCIGAGSAGIASMNLLVGLGAKKENIYLIDRNGVIHDERDDLNKFKKQFAIHTSDRTLADAMKNADVMIGVSGPNIVDAEMLQSMAEKPIVFALSNPDPEINRDVAVNSRDDIIMATGRSDYPNQVNNVLGFPFIFRGALDVRASAINQEMQMAAVYALSDLAREPVPQSVLDAYKVDSMEFGKDYIIPKPLDPRLMDTVPPRIAKAAVDTGVAQKPYPPHYPPIK